jgi:hypothetical protein
MLWVVKARGGGCPQLEWQRNVLMVSVLSLQFLSNITNGAQTRPLLLLWSSSSCFVTSQSWCNPQDFQYFFSVDSLYRFGSRYKRKPHSLQNITEVSSLWFLLLTGAVQAQRENRQSSYVCLSARKGREAFISRDICGGGATLLLWQLENFRSYVDRTAAHLSLRDVFN